eukprot:909062-Pelagomonas_calceolata.AAC.3
MWGQPGDLHHRLYTAPNQNRAGNKVLSASGGNTEPPTILLGHQACSSAPHATYKPDRLTALDRIMRMSSLEGTLRLAHQAHTSIHTYALTRRHALPAAHKAVALRRQGRLMEAHGEVGGQLRLRWGRWICSSGSSGWGGRRRWMRSRRKSW